MDRLEEILRELRTFVAERDWQQFHDPKNLAMAVGSEAGELLAEYRWVSNTDADAHSQKPEARARIAAEVADVAIALLLFCDRIGLDLPGAIKQKLERNRLNYPVNLSRGRSDRPAPTVADASASTAPDSASCSAGIICGIDGCRRGWVAAIHDLSTRETMVKVFATLAELVRQESPAIVAIDIPIGLPEVGSRRCDVEARRHLGKRGSCVFPAPLRPLLAARNHAEASKRRLKIEDRGLSIQAWSIVPKIREVDEFLKCSPELRGRIREVHPEVCFCFMANGRPMAHPKKTVDGRGERVRMLTQHFGDVIARCIEQKPSGFGQDDVIDAFAALWTAQRIVRGDAVKIPKGPDLDSLGLPMEILA